MKEFRDRVAVVTGGASGIGRGLVGGFLEAGMKVVIADVEEEALASEVRMLRDTGADVIGVVTDVSKADQIENLAAETLDAFGAVHVLCNNAGVGYGVSRLWEIPLEGWEWVLGVNLMGVVNGVRTFVPIMLDQDTEAHIVNTASLAGLISAGDQGPYIVSKHGVVALSETLYLQLARVSSKVKVSVLCPGNINTNIIDADRNKPNSIPGVREPEGRAVLLAEAYRHWLEQGMTPAEVADHVMTAIREEQFYIITHDWDNAIAQRVHNILERKNPERSTEGPPGMKTAIQEMMDKQK